MPGTAKGARRGKDGAGGLASALFNKFDSDRKYDPFSDADPVVKDSKEGMETLLAMCNAVEINSLYGALGFVVPCPRNAKEQQIMRYIREGGRNVEKKFADVLKFCWEGLLFEYLRAVGCPLRNREHDPRHFVMRYWRRSLLDPRVQPGFVPFYAKREIKKRNSMMQEDRDIRDIRAGLLLREARVKDAEAKTRGQHDYRFVLQYFSTSRDLHRTLVANVNYLANEVEQLRANMDHNSESIVIMEQQLVELETKYDRVVGGLVHRGAFQLTFEGALYSMINEGHVALKTAERKAIELLGSMNHGPDGYDSVRSETAGENNATNEERGEDVSPSPSDLPTSASRSAVGLDAAEEMEGQRTPEVDVTNAQIRPAAVNSRESERLEETAPRAGEAPDRSSSSHSGSRNQQRTASTGTTSVTFDESVPPTRQDEQVRHVDDGHDTSGGLSSERTVFSREIGPCLDQVLDIHQLACTRYGNQVAELERQNAALATRAVEASRHEGEAATQAKLWETRCGELEGRLAATEERSREELARAEERGEEARFRGMEAMELLRVTVEAATPALLDMLTGFAPRDTEGYGVDLLRSLRIEPDFYVHILARKSMFQADLESRALEALYAERKKVLAEAEAAEQEETETAAAAGGGKGKKRERGRPKSRGKGGSGADKGKSKSGGSPSKPGKKSPTGKGAKKTTEKGGASKEKRTAGKDQKPAAGKSGGKAVGGTDEGRNATAATRGVEKPSSVDRKRTPSPAKTGTAGKGSKKKK
ncbi:unnamed protein product [Scytosiphon promiscuus]